MKKSLWHQKVEVLYERMSPADPQYNRVREELQRCVAGLEGEKRVYYFLSELNESFRILHDIRLPSPNGVTHFQIDTIVICPSIIFIFEIKHISGHLTFNRQTNQLTRGNQVFGDPIAQVQRQERFLLPWLPKPIPVLPLVVISHPRAKVDFVPEDSPDRAFLSYPAELGARMDEKLNGRLPVLSMKEVHELANRLQANHRPYDPGLLTVFGVEKDRILKGIRCPACRTLTVKKVAKRWTCLTCRQSFKTAHIKALHEYILLFGPKITNRELRDFLGIESRSVSEKLLKKWRESSEGTTRDYTHIIKNPIE
ncbi:nuclease-related domain-containing protein [Domibacillus indicus]|uniref:nuclease-related domain-containing protein n=1 Tax=Domibacillus indicus TaxID=1437523 RepID=UPI000617BBD4|nr:nuclease-related domain-containing protein [Domibacillus indicus]